MKKYAGICCVLGWLLCAVLQIGTLYYAARANRLAGKSVASHYFILGSIQFGILALVILFRILSPGSLSK
jgi:hypothetical protein